MEVIIKRKCRKHGVVKHYIRKDKGGGFRCSKCSSDAVSKRRRKLKLMAIEYLGGSCIICGYSKSVWALAFHHVHSKEFTIAHRGHTRSWKKLKAELDKCVLLCHNCHAEYHAGLITIPD